MTIEKYNYLLWHEFWSILKFFFCSKCIKTINEFWGLRKIIVKILNSIKTVKSKKNVNNIWQHFWKISLKNRVKFLIGEENILKKMYRNLWLLWPLRVTLCWKQLCCVLPKNAIIIMVDRGCFCHHVGVGFCVFHS